jgi:hypothetical protein
VALLASAPTASAAIDPGTFAIARQLTVSSSVLVKPRKAEMMGGWTSGALDCSRRRLLEVRIAIDRVRSGKTTRLRDERSGLVQNCAEGGPNFGFQPTASQAGMACPDGTWRPGRYTFVANTLYRARGLRAIASPVLRRDGPLLRQRRMRLAGIEPATSRSGGARSIP